MIFTIASLEDLSSNITVDFGRVGNEYEVSIRHNETKELTHKTYEEKEDAYKVFLQLTQAILEGCYSYEDRKAML